MVKGYCNVTTIKCGKGSATFPSEYIDAPFYLQGIRTVQAEGSFYAQNIHISMNPGSRDRNYEEIGFNDLDLTCDDGEVYNPSDEELREFDESPSIRLR